MKSSTGLNGEGDINFSALCADFIKTHNEECRLLLKRMKTLEQLDFAFKLLGEAIENVN